MTWDADWRAWQRLREGQAEPGDLSYLLARFEDLWRRVRELEPKAGLYDAMRAAYEQPGEAKPTTRQRQAAACKAGGLSHLPSPGDRIGRDRIVNRWLALIRETRDPQRALERLAEEERASRETTARTLRKLREEMKDLIRAGHPDSAFLEQLVKELSEGGSAAIPGAG